MKAPKYADGGKTPVKKYTTKEWNELNTKAGYKTAPGAYSNPDASYMEFYDPKVYSLTNDGKSISWQKIGDPNWKYSSEANSPFIKYTPPVEVPKTSIVKPMVDPNRKPLVFGSGSTYDPNTGKYYNSANPSQEIKPQILQYKNGGVVSKIKGYASGGVTTYDNDGNPLDESGNPVVADNMQSRDSTSALNQDNEAKMNDTVNTADSAINNTSMQETKQSSSNKPKFDSNAAYGAGASLLTGVGSGLAINQAAKIDAKGKDNRGRYTSKDAAVKGTTLKGTALGTQIGGAVGTAFGPLGSLVGAGAGAAIGSGVGALVGVKKGKKDADSIDSSNKKMAAEIAVANQQSRQQQAILNRNNGVLDATLVNPYNKQNASFDEKDNLVRSFNKGGVVGKVKQMCANGGTIKGEGGPKEDKINAKIKPGSFVVPAKNAEVAEELRERILMKSPRPKANLSQSGGAKVKLSNGEHLFTPEEKEELLENGIDVNLLAPNAENKEHKIENKNRVMFPKVVGFANGGEVDGDIDKLLKQIQSIKQQQLDAEKQAAINAEKAKKSADYQSKIASYEEAAMKDRYTKKALADKEAELTKAVNEYQKEVSKDSRYTSGNAGGATGEKAKRLYEKVSNLVNDYSAATKNYESKNKQSPNVDKANNVAATTPKTNTVVAPKVKAPRQSDKTYEELIKKPFEFKGTDAEWKSAADKAIKEGKVIPKGGSTTVNNISLKSPKSNSNKFVSAPPIPSRDVAISELQKDNELRSNNDIDKADYAISSQKTSPYTPSQIPPTTQPNKLSGIASKIGKGIGNVDPTAFLGIGQGVLGYNMLKGQVRPVYKAVIDPTYNEAVNRSINDARFGLTPEQQAVANNDIEAARRDAAYAGLVTSGGSGVQAYNTAQNAANQAWKAKLGLKVADQDLRMQKQQYADAQVANRANILAGNRRQAFNDAMGTFQQKQQAGSELIGAGLANTIGAYRFNQEAKNRKAADLEREAWTRNIGNS